MAKQQEYEWGLSLEKRITQLEAEVAWLKARVNELLLNSAIR